MWYTHIGWGVAACQSKKGSRQDRAIALGCLCVQNALQDRHLLQVWRSFFSGQPHQSFVEMETNMQNWHTLNEKAVAENWNSDLQNGLSDELAASRLAEIGPNELIDRGTKSPWKILWEQMTGIMVVILIISAVIS